MPTRCWPTRAAVDRSRRLRPRRLPRRARRPARELRTRRRPEPGDRRGRGRRPPASPGEPARGRGLVRDASRDRRRSRCSGPVDINGLPRTGTTALANMLSLDPQFRSLRRWEQAQPCPPPTIDGRGRPIRDACSSTRENEQLLGRSSRRCTSTRSTPRWRTRELLGMAFHGQQYTLPVYGYHAWWRTADATPTYEYHRRVVKLLAVATAAGPLAVQGAAPQLPPRGDPSPPTRTRGS